MFLRDLYTVNSVHKIGIKEGCHYLSSWPQNAVNKEIDIVSTKNNNDYSRHISLTWIVNTLEPTLGITSGSVINEFRHILAQWHTCKQCTNDFTYITLALQICLWLNKRLQA